MTCAFFRWRSTTWDILTTSSTSPVKIQSFKRINCSVRGNGWLAVTTACRVLPAPVRTGQRLVSSKSPILTLRWESLVYQSYHFNDSYFLTSAATKNYCLVKRSKKSKYQVATHQMSLINQSACRGSDQGCQFGQKAVSWKLSDLCNLRYSHAPFQRCDGHFDLFQITIMGCVGGKCKLICSLNIP